MPLLLKFNKAKIKSFQAGGSTQFYATAGFNASPTKFAVYNPGKLLEAYAPALGEVKEKKEVKTPEFKFEGEGHIIDTNMASAKMSSLLNEIKDAEEANLPQSFIKQKYDEAFITLGKLNNERKRYLDRTNFVKKEVLEDNQASKNLAFNNGNYFGTLETLDKNGKTISQDIQMPAEQYLEMLKDNENLVKEKKPLTQRFTPITYEDVFKKRENDYGFEDGDKLITDIASGGMGLSKAEEIIQKKFAGLNETQVKELRTIVNRVDNVTNKTMDSESVSNNARQLKAVTDQLYITTDPKVKAALERQAYENVMKYDWNEIPNDPTARAKFINKAKDIRYAQVVASIIDPHRKSSIGSAEVNQYLAAKDKEGSEFGGSENLGKLDHYMSDFLGEQKQFNFESFIVNSKLTGNSEDDKNLLTVVSGNKATSATGWVGKKLSEKQENHNIDVANGAEEDKARPVVVKFSELVGDDKNPSPFSSESLNNAVYITGDKISPDIKARSIVLPGSDTDIVYFPVDKNTGKTIIGSQIKALALIPLLTKYKKRMEDAYNKYELNKSQPKAQVNFYNETKAATNFINGILDDAKLNLKIQAFHKQRMVVRVDDEDDLNKETIDEYKIPFKPMDVMSKNYEESNDSGDPIVEPAIYSLLDSGFDRLGIKAATLNDSDEDTHIYDALFPIPLLHEFAELSGDNSISKEELTIRHNTKKQSAISGKVTINR